jgi:hypothetical protein
MPPFDPDHRLAGIGAGQIAASGKVAASAAALAVIDDLLRGVQPQARLVGQGAAVHRPREVGLIRPDKRFRHEALRGVT